MPENVKQVLFKKGNMKYVRLLLLFGWAYSTRITEDFTCLQDSSTCPAEMKKERKGAYKEYVSEWLAQNIYPVDYHPFLHEIESVVSPVISVRTDDEVAHERLDAWYFYLGLEQKRNTLEISPYKPAKSAVDSATYYRIPKMEEFIFSTGMFALKTKGVTSAVIDDFLNQKAHLYLPDTILQKERGDSFFKPQPEEERKLAEKYHLDVKLEDLKKYFPDDFVVGVMGNYTVSLGEEVGEDGKIKHYLSYYDIWDLDPIECGSSIDEIGIGKPFEIYSRIYYNPETNERLSEY